MFDLRCIFNLIGKDLEDKPVKTMICDTYDTLIDSSGTLDEDLHSFLRWAKHQGADLIITSARPKEATTDLLKTGFNEFLIPEGVQEIMAVQYRLYMDDAPYVAINDDPIVSLEAAIYINPGNQKFRGLIESGAYKTAPVTFGI